MLNSLMPVINYLLYFGTTLVLLIVSGAIYVKFTPGDEVKLIREGNVAAAVALGGAMIGYSAVVYTATVHGGGWLDTVMWSGISLIVQIIACELLCFVIHDKWKEAIARGDLAHGIALGSFSLAVGLLNAGCIVP